MSHQSLYRQLRPGPGKKRDEVAANQRSRLLAATIQIVSEQGYEGITVSKVARLAGVSKASFYQLFSGKEECFAATCDMAVREAAAAVLRGEAAGGQGRERLRGGLTALAELIVAQPDATKLVLVDSLASTPAIREHLHRRFGLLETLVRERLAGEGRLSRSLTTGIVRGISHHVRRCVWGGNPDRFRDLVDPLLDWGLGFNCEEAVSAFSAPVPPIRAAGPSKRVRPKGHGTDVPGDTRDLLVAATLRLASLEGYGALTPSRIRRTAGVSRPSFDANFEDAASCFLTAVEVEVGKLFAEALQAGPRGESWPERTCLVLERLAASLADVPDLTRLIFVETLEAAPSSLRWRERLFADWAEALYREAPAASRPTPAVAEATVAALWGFIGDLALTDRLHLLPAQTARLSLFTLTPTIGVSDAAEVSYERFLLSASPD